MILEVLMHWSLHCCQHSTRGSLQNHPAGVGCHLACLSQARPQTLSHNLIDDPSQGCHPMCRPQPLILLSSLHVPNLICTCPAQYTGESLPALQSVLVSAVQPIGAQVPTPEVLCRVVMCHCCHQLASGAVSHCHTVLL